MPLRNLIIVTVAALLVVAILVAPWSGSRAAAPASAVASHRPNTQPVQPNLRGESARAAAAVSRLSSALQQGDVEALCRPGAILTPAVVAAMAQGGQSCEADVEAELSASVQKPVTLTGITTERDLATAQVHSPTGADVPLTLLRDGRRWLVSFSHGGDPISALTG